MADLTPNQYFLKVRKMIFSRGLKNYPAPSPEEIQGTKVFERLFFNLKSPIVITYPLTNVKVELNHLIGPRLSYLISIGDYERSDLELIDRHVKKGDKVLEIGAGAGITAAQIVRKSKTKVVVVDPDARLEALVKKQTKLNGGKAEFIKACVVVTNESKVKSVKFFIAEELWFSSIYKGKTKKLKAISSPAVALNTLLKKYRPDILMMDIEGAESALFEVPLDHYPKKIIIELHTPTYGIEIEKRVTQRILSQGYKKVDAKCWTHVFENIHRSSPKAVGI